MQKQKPISWYCQVYMEWVNLLPSTLKGQFESVISGLNAFYSIAGAYWQWSGQRVFLLNTQLVLNILKILSFLVFLPINCFRKAQLLKTLEEYTRRCLNPNYKSRKNQNTNSLDIVQATGVRLENGCIADHLVQSNHEEHQVDLGKVHSWM